MRAISFLSFVFLLYSCSASSPHATASYSHQKYKKLFSVDHPVSTGFCNPKKDIRITLLGQAWIQFPLSGTNLTYENVTGLINQLATFNSTVLLSNLETAINGTYAQVNGAAIVNPDQPHVADPGVIDILQKNYSINILTTSNNHYADFGPNGTISGWIELDQRGMKWTGSGLNDTQARTPTFLQHKNGKKVGILGLVGATQTRNRVGWMANATFPGVNGLPMINTGNFNFVPDPAVVQLNLDAMSNGCRAADLMIQYHHNHWNTTGNGTYGIAPWWKDLAHQIIDAGASVYLSQGNQNIRGIETYKGNLLFYSNGNLFFEGTVDATPDIQEGFVADLCFDGVTTKLKAARVIPTILTNGEGTWPSLSWNQTHGLPELSSAGQALSTLNLLKNLSIPMGTEIVIDEDELIGYIVLQPQVAPDSALNCTRNVDLALVATSQSTLESSKLNEKVGKKVKFTVTISSSPSFNPKPTGRVVFTIDGVALPSVRVKNAKVKYETDTLSIGSHTVSASYSGDGRYSSSVSNTLTQIIHS